MGKSITYHGIDRQHCQAHGSVSMFGGAGERTRKGNDLYMEMKESGFINGKKKIAE